MTYLEGDVWSFVAQAPYLRLSTPKRATEFLSRHLELLSECFVGLDEYPAVEVESLDFFYTTARSLGMLDPESLEVMTTALTWRGVVWGGWLALMAPSQDYAEALERGWPPGRYPENFWPAECALALLRGEPVRSELAVVNELASRVREAIRVMHIARRPLRCVPTEQEAEVLARQRARVHEAYRSGGLDEALRALRGTALHELTMPYSEWRLGRRAKAAGSSA